MRAAVLEQLNAPLEIREVTFPFVPQYRGSSQHLDYGQVLVRVLCAGICGAQLQEISGAKGDPSHLPHLLGHEGCGIVEGTGPGVTHVKGGDKTVIHWRKGDGCDVSGATFDGIKSGPITCFSEYSVVSENRLTPVPQDFPNDLACLLGCSLSTALGVIENEAKVRFGESVLIIGCGGLGLALILAARLAHAGFIIATDIIDKRDLVDSIGAAFVEPVELFEQPLSRGLFDVIIDTTGNPASIGAASLSLKDSGRLILVGQPSPEMPLMLPKFHHLFNGTGKTIKATQGGGFSPSTDIPRYVNLWRSGALDNYSKLITHRLPLEQINEGLDLVRQGKAGRVLIEMNK